MIQQALITLSSPPSDRPNLILLHGFTGSPYSWDALVPELETRYRVTRPYLPGHHPDDEGCCGFTDAGSQIAALLEALKPPRTLLGYSLGGRLALYTTIHYPHLVEKLILESATPGLEDESERIARKQVDDELAQSIRIKGLAWFADYWANIPLFQSHQKLPAELRAAQRSERVRHSVEGLAQSLEHMGTGVMPSMWSQLQSIHRPVHLITGALDSRYEAIANEMRDMVRRAEHSVIPHSGHTPHLEAPRLFLEAVFH